MCGFLRFVGTYDRVIAGILAFEEEKILSAVPVVGQGSWSMSIWVAVKELAISCCSKETLVFTIYP